MPSRLSIRPAEKSDRGSLSNTGQVLLLPRLFHSQSGNRLILLLFMLRLIKFLLHEQSEDCLLSVQTVLGLIVND